MSFIKNKICDGLLGDFDDLKGVADDMLNRDLSIQTDLGSALSDLSGSFGNVGDVVGAMGQFQLDLELEVPDLTSVAGDIVSMINDCSSLNPSPLNLYGKIDFNGVFDSLLSGLSPILDIAKGIFDYKFQLEINFNMPGLIAEMDGILNCLSSTCSVVNGDIIDEVDNRINGLETSLGQFNLKVDGSLDTDKLYDSVGLSSEEKEIINVSVDLVASAKASFDNNVAQGRDTLAGRVVTEQNEIYLHFNEPTFEYNDTLYDVLDFDRENQSGYITYWNNLRYPSTLTNKVGLLDVSITIIDTSINEVSDPEIECYAVFNVTVTIKIGNKSYTGDGSYARGASVCGNLCGNYETTGFTFCDEQDMEYNKKYMSDAVKQSINNTLRLFKTSDITNQLS